MANGCNTCGHSNFFMCYGPFEPVNGPHDPEKRIADWLGEHPEEECDEYGSPLNPKRDCPQWTPKKP